MIKVRFPPTIGIKKYELLMVKGFYNLKEKEKII